MKKKARSRPKVEYGETILEVRVMRRKTTHSRDVVLAFDSWEQLAGARASITDSPVPTADETQRILHAAKIEYGRQIRGRGAEK